MRTKRKTGTAELGNNPDKLRDLLVSFSGIKGLFTSYWVKENEVFLNEQRTKKRDINWEVIESHLNSFRDAADLTTMVYVDEALVDESPELNLDTAYRIRQLRVEQQMQGNGRALYISLGSTGALPYERFEDLVLTIYGKRPQIVSIERKEKQLSKPFHKRPSDTARVLGHPDHVHTSKSEILSEV